MYHFHSLLYGNVMNRVQEQQQQQQRQEQL
jgi:hypothetical protein